MKKYFFILILLGNLTLSAQVLRDINETTRNVMDIFKGAKPKETSENNSNAKTEQEISGSFSNPNKAKICAELCIDNLSKFNSKVTLEYKLTEERQQLLIMKKDKSCIYDIPFGIYTIKIFQDDKLVKKSDYKVEDQDQISIVIPE
jgi:hypothetical protein